MVEGTKDFWSLFYKNSNPVHDLITSQSLHLQILSHWGLNFFQYINFWGYNHLVYSIGFLSTPQIFKLISISVPLVFCFETSLSKYLHRSLSPYLDLNKRHLLREAFHDHSNQRKSPSPPVAHHILDSINFIFSRNKAPGCPKYDFYVFFTYSLYVKNFYPPIGI